MIIWRSGLRDQRINLHSNDVLRFLKTLLNLNGIKLRGNYSNKMHLYVFVGIWGLSLTTITAALLYQFKVPYQLNLKQTILTLLFDIFGFLSLVGVIMAAYRRYRKKRDIMVNTREDGFILFLLLALLMSGFLLEGLRMYINPGDMSLWSPFGLGITYLLKLSRMSLNTSRELLQLIWYGHMIMALGFIAYIPYSKLFHIITAPINKYLSSLYPIGLLPPLPAEVSLLDSNVTPQGIFTWKQLLENDACVGCFRCQKHCPVLHTGQPLAPKELIQDSKKPMVMADDIWACTTCLQCQERCPVAVEHVGKIINMRRYLIAHEDYPEEVELIFQRLKAYGNPYGIDNINNKNWLKGLRVTPLHKRKKAKVLYWVGCAGAIDERSQKIARALVEIFQKTKVDFTVLGNDHSCCGHMARRLGNEELFQDLAKKNIETLNYYEFDTIVTHCPHCLYTLKHEYTQLGSNFEVIHHTQFIKQMLKTRQLKSAKTMPKNKLMGNKVTYHDPCYLGRYNDIYSEPREVINFIPGIKLFEVKPSFNSSFCCGGGNNLNFLENQHSTSISLERTKQALATNADMVITSCPFCLTMISKGVQELGYDQRVQTLDLAELVNLLLR